MRDRLPIKLNDLLRQRTVEGERIEYKAGWNPDAILRTLCAFANDFENLGGGYIVIGLNCDGNGQPILPPVGLLDEQLQRNFLHETSGWLCSQPALPEPSHWRIPERVGSDRGTLYWRAKDLQSDGPQWLATTAI